MNKQELTTISLAYDKIDRIGDWVAFVSKHQGIPRYYFGWKNCKISEAIKDLEHCIRFDATETFKIEKWREVYDTKYRLVAVDNEMDTADEIDRNGDHEKGYYSWEERHPKHCGIYRRYNVDRDGFTTGERLD